MFKKKIIKDNLAIEMNKQVVTPEENKKISEAVAAYTHAAQFFEKHIAEEEIKKTKSMRRLCIFFGVIALMSVLAVLLLTPLKTVVPYVIRVDNNSGYTDIVKPGAEQDIKDTDDAYWSVNYVTQRESYNFSTQESRSKFVELTSYDGTYTEYKNFQLSKKGYMDVLGDKQQIRVLIRNVGEPQKDDKTGQTTIQIRFTKTVLDEVGTPVNGLEPTTWLATVSFDYSKSPKTKEEEWMNPRGFGVHSYQPSQEIGY